jgi:hypothetical protein
MRRIYFYFSLTHSRHPHTHSVLVNGKCIRPRWTGSASPSRSRCDGICVCEWKYAPRRKLAKNTFDMIKKPTTEKVAIADRCASVGFRHSKKCSCRRVCNKNMTYLGRCTLASQHEEKVRHAWPYTDRTLHTRHLIWKMHAAPFYRAQRTVKIAKEQSMSF